MAYAYTVIYNVYLKIDLCYDHKRFHGYSESNITIIMCLRLRWANTSAKLHPSRLNIWSLNVNFAMCLKSCGMSREWWSPTAPCSRISVAPPWTEAGAFQHHGERSMHSQPHPHVLCSWEGETTQCDGQVVVVIIRFEWRDPSEVGS